MTSSDQIQKPEAIEMESVEIQETHDASKEHRNITESLLIMQMPATLSALSDDDRRRIEKRLVRKLDTRLMAPLIIMYIMNYLDRLVLLLNSPLFNVRPAYSIITARNAIAAAKISGIMKDLDLTDSQFQTCVSILFLG